MIKGAALYMASIINTYRILRIIAWKQNNKQTMKVIGELIVNQGYSQKLETILAGVS